MVDVSVLKKFYKDKTKKMFDNHFPQVNRLQETVKSYTTMQGYNKARAKLLLENINNLRLDIALDAEMRRIYYGQLNIPANASGYKEDTFFTKNDIDYTIRRGVANLLDAVTVSLARQSGDLRVITRENTSWQMAFSDIQLGAIRGQQSVFDFPMELRMQENESLAVGVTGQTSTGQLFFHGCTLKERLDINAKELQAEFVENGVTKYLPQFTIVPLSYIFTGAADTYATDLNGNPNIFSIKNDKTVILTHVSTTGLLCRLDLIDEGKNLEICSQVEMSGLAADYLNATQNYYPLPYPHLLRRGDRLKIRVLNGSQITATAQATGVTNYLTFYGFYL